MYLNSLVPRPSLLLPPQSLRTLGRSGPEYLKYSASEFCELPYRLSILQSFRSPDAGAPVATYTAFVGYM